jgi:8-oxo-dGTP pyrophosphatase MutT (NUDIX family)
LPAVPVPGSARDAPRALVHSLLADRLPFDAREQASIEQILFEVDRLTSPFDEHADLTHVTGSAVVAGPRGVLLLVHRRLGFWMQPGGHLEPGEAPWEAAAREAREETGLTVHHPAGGPVLVHADVHRSAQEHTHLDLRFLVFAPADDTPRPPPEESQAVRWFTWDDAFEVADESLRGALVSARPIACDNR